MEISAFQELEIGVKSRERPMLLWSGFINDFCSDKTSHYPDSSGRCVCVCVCVCMYVCMCVLVA